MHITTTGGNAQIDCYLVLNDKTAVQVFDVLDDSAPILGTGLSGFIMPGEMQGWAGLAAPPVGIAQVLTNPARVVFASKP